MYNKIVQLEVCRTFSGRGMGMNITAQLRWCRYAVHAAARRRDDVMNDMILHNCMIYYTLLYSTIYIILGEHLKLVAHRSVYLRCIQD